MSSGLQALHLYLGQYHREWEPLWQATEQDQLGVGRAGGCWVQILTPLITSCALSGTPADFPTQISSPGE